MRKQQSLGGLLIEILLIEVKFLLIGNFSEASNPLGKLQTFAQVKFDRLLGNLELPQ